MKALARPPVDWPKRCKRLLEKVRKMRTSPRALALLGLALLPTGGLTSSPELSAQEKVYEISDFSARLEVRPDGSYRIHEAITFDFMVGTFSFVARDIPLSNVDDLANFSIQSSDVEITSIGEERDGDVWHARWEFPPTTGKVTFQLEYDLLGAIRELDGENEVLWVVVGKGWGVPFRQVTADVFLPPELAVQPSTVTPDPADISTVVPEGDGVGIRFVPGALGAGEGYQVRVRFPAVIHGRPVGLARPEVRALLLGGLGFLVFLSLGVLAWSRRRGERLPPRRSTSPELDIPTAAVLLHRRGPGWERAFPATLFDLAQRGAVILERVDEKGKVFTTQKLKLHRSPEFHGVLTEFEERFLQELEGYASELDAFTTKGRKFRKRTMEAVQQDLVRQGYLIDDGKGARRWIILGLLTLLGGVLAFGAGLGLGKLWLMVLLGPGAGAGLGLLFLGGVRYPRTRQGAEALAPLEGYLEGLREDLKQKLKMSPISAAEFLFEILPWLTLDPRYLGAETRTLSRKLKKDSGELHAPPWARDRTREFQKVAGRYSQAYAAFFPVQHVTAAVGGAVATGGGGGAVGGAAGGGGAGGGGGGAG